MSYRYFINFDEFKKVTGCDIGTAITTRFKNDSDEIVRLVVAFNDSVGSISLGTQTFSYREIFDNYLFLNKKTGKFELLGIEIEDEPKPKKVRPAKFQVGHTYKVVDDDEETNEAHTIMAKFSNAVTGDLQVVMDGEIYDVYADKDDNEYINLDGFGTVRCCANLEL